LTIRDTVTTLIRAAVLTGYADLARQVGLDPRLPERFGLPRACLTDPDIRIPAGAVGRLLEAAGEVDETFGARLAEGRRLSNLGPLALIIREQSTLGEALEALSRYIRLHNEALGTRLTRVGDVVLVEPVFADVRRVGRQAVELVMAVLMRLIRSLAGPGWRPLRVTLPHGSPRDGAVHRRVFGPDLEFGAELACILIPADDLARPIASADPVLARQLAAYVEDLMNRAPAAFPAQVRELARALLPTGQCTVDRVAQHMGVDRRTVHRRLAADGTSFSRVLLALRLVQARRHLAARDRSLTEVSEMLGFSALSAFSRWRRQHAAELG
jgi:AraC-like DNA-binding protein